VRRRALTRREFLKIAGAGMAGATLVGATGCSVTERIRNVVDPPSVESGTNVVLVIIDSLRKDHIGAYGNETIHSPNLDALAKDSLRFTRAYPESIPTICARRAIHTGMRTWPFRDWIPPKGEDIILQGWEPIPNYQTTLAEMMKAVGYGTYFVTDNMHQFKPSYNMHRGFDVFDFFRGQTTDNYRPAYTYPKDKVDQALLKGNVPAMKAQMQQYFANVKERKTEADWFSPMVFTQAADYLEILGKAEPFFLTVDVYDPHEPWDPPEKYTNMYSDGYGGPEPITSSSGRSDWMTEAQLDRMRALYSGEVTMMDHWLGNFMQRAEELGLMENTMFVFLSDHGHAFGEHGYAGKVVTALYPELTDTVFMIKHPNGKGAGETSDFFVSTHDVTPTILGALGVEPAAPLEGQDLTPLLDGGETERARPYFTAGYHDHVWARDDRYAMFARYDGAEAKLFDLEKDPKMDKDIASANPDVAKKMFTDYVVEDAGGPLPSY
jgi:arylsulfatase A-like enzyme